ncbi:MAG: hypothetical protein JJLCMIEE_02906 [Acidimicrobiales bacterium]|nr:MAG: hypothetical protein EDR02_14905 [Actinomycetota bacterium]MBV6509806.1 hypothetical protein [Acidimicrobiales bacterium]RIK04405.1 MAG: hypothetical protein DCC48_13585 [Acidobacteriota bacterium]
MEGVAVQFSEAVRVVSEAARSLALVSPSFRTPPRTPGVDRAITRRPTGVMVALQVADRPFAAVMADLVEGVVAANNLSGVMAARIRRHLWDALTQAAPRAHLRPVPDHAGAVA